MLCRLSQRSIFICHKFKIKLENGALDNLIHLKPLKKRDFKFMMTSWFLANSLSNLKIWLYEAQVFIEIDSFTL